MTPNSSQEVQHPVPLMQFVQHRLNSKVPDPYPGRWHNLQKVTQVKPLTSKYVLIHRIDKSPLQFSMQKELQFNIIVKNK